MASYDSYGFSDADRDAAALLATTEGLPAGSTKEPWPPNHMRRPLEHMHELDAWYSGDPERLSFIYGGTTGAEHPFWATQTGVRNHPAQYRGGLVGTIARMWWGKPTPAGEKRAKPHVPLAGDIARLSADLLFSEPPDIACKTEDGKPDEPTQKRLDKILDGCRIDKVLHEAAEVQSPLGGVYLVISWDKDFAPHPILRAVHVDAGLPEFKWGRLWAVTFWSEVREEHGKVWRHLERHERGRILHGLYQGTCDTLGVPVPLKESSATARLEPTVATIEGRLTAAYIPNMLPNRSNRNSPLGRSDFSPGVLTLFDALDESWASWMRDLRLAKHRLVVPRAYLQPQGPGRGARFDADREIFEAIDALPDKQATSLVTPTSFAIRVAEHQQTTDQLVAQALRGAGYSLQSIGEGDDGAAITATEAESRERRSYLTRKAKTRYWRPEEEEILHTLLLLDVKIFGTKGITPARPEVEFGDGVADSPEALARTLSLLETAGAISTDMKVRSQHPDWEDGRVREEVARIMAEKGQGAIGNPDEFRGAGADGSVRGGSPRGASSSTPAGEGGQQPGQPAGQNGRRTPADQPSSPDNRPDSSPDNTRRRQRTRQ